MFSLLCLFENTENKRAVFYLRFQVLKTQWSQISEAKDELAKESQCRCPAHLILLIIYGRQKFASPLQLEVWPTKSKDN